MLSLQTTYIDVGAESLLKRELNSKFDTFFHNLQMNNAIKARNGSHFSQVKFQFLHGYILPYNKEMPKTLKWFIKRVYQTMGSFTVLNEPYQKVSHTNAKMTQIEFHTNSQEN